MTESQSNVITQGLQLAVPLLQRFEGLRLARYADTQGVPTIGFGTTEGELGYPVPATCTYAQAAAWLIDGLNKIYCPWINELVAQGVPITAHMYAALASLSYNEGPGVGNWQIGVDLRNRNMVAASADFLRYAIPSVLLGRRIAERAYFETPDTPATLPKPVDPNHYDDYPAERMSYHGYSFIEQALAKDIDAWLEHPLFHRERLQDALPLAEAAAKRIWVVSVYQGPEFKVKREKPEWGEDHRGLRYQLWGKRIKAVEKALS